MYKSQWRGYMDMIYNLAESGSRSELRWRPIPASRPANEHRRVSSTEVVKHFLSTRTGCIGKADYALLMRRCMFYI